jgi:hypothetical protein
MSAIINSTFERLFSKEISADFEGGQITSDAGGLLLRELGHSSISITMDIYGHWITGEGKKDLTATLRGPKARPRQTLTVAAPGRE